MPTSAPSVTTFSATYAFSPLMNVTTAITAATPMTIPSSVKTVRSLFAHNDARAMRIDSAKFMNYSDFTSATLDPNPTKCSSVCTWDEWRANNRQRTTTLVASRPIATIPPHVLCLAPARHTHRLRTPLLGRQHQRTLRTPLLLRRVRLARPLPQRVPRLLHRERHLAHRPLRRTRLVPRHLRRHPRRPPRIPPLPRPRLLHPLA